MRAIKAAGLAALLVMLISPAVQAGPPTEQLQSGMDRIFTMLADPGLKPADKLEEKRAKVFAVAEELFDFGHTARLALGAHWDRLSPTERDEFIALFKGFIQKAYITNVEMYDGEKIVYAAETVDGEKATVKSRIVTKSGGEIPVDFRLLRTEGDRWRLYDVAIDGMSLVGNYRVQFMKVMKAESYQALVQKLRAKQ
ncbi:MAG: ABC transporter substrate-binding protein [Candidatus Rokubacteria bacterium]|nr:ABC transporter substrate-binding protein [Candidatus Rokubacteria bacterium]